MTAYYVRKTGSNGAAGTSAGAAWATINYAIANIAAGDTIYVGAGTYREQLDAFIAGTLGVETRLIGDTDGSQTGDAGEVIVTAYLTNDTTAPTSGATASTVYESTQVKGWTFERLTFIGGSTGAANAGSCVWMNKPLELTIRDCTFWGHPGALYCVTLDNYLPTEDGDTLIERCRIFAISNGLFMGYFASTGSGDRDLNQIVQNCIIWAVGGKGVVIEGVANTSVLHGGLVLRNNLIISGSSSVGVFSAGLYRSTVYPDRVENSVIYWGNLVANHSGELTEDYNVLVGASRTLVSAGTHSKDDGSYMTAFHFGQELAWGGVPRPFGMPVAGSPLLGYGAADASVTDDLLGGIRPGSGIGSVVKAIGPLERANSGTRETGTVHTSATSLKLSGPGYQDFELPVAAGSQSVTVWTRWDATYAGTKPQLLIRNGGQCGVADVTTTATGSADTWEQLSASITPTAAGIVTMRLQSNDTNGGGLAYFAEPLA